MYVHMQVETAQQEATRMNAFHLQSIQTNRTENQTKTFTSSVTIIFKFALKSL